MLGGRMTGVARECAKVRVGLRFVTGGGDGKGVGGFASACTSSNKFPTTANKQRRGCQKRNHEDVYSEGEGKERRVAGSRTKARQVSKPHS